MLAEHAPDIDPAADESMREFIARRKESMSDQWY